MLQEPRSSPKSPTISGNSQCSRYLIRLSCLQIPLISQKNIQKITTGRIIDLISNDVQRVELVPKWFFLASAVAFEVPVVVSLMLFLIGWQALMGMLFLLVTLPFVLILSHFSAELRHQTAEVSDRRISLMDELVSGIRGLKAHAWEDNYIEKVKEIRR